VVKLEGSGEDHMPFNHKAQSFKSLDDQEIPHDEQGTNGRSSYIPNALNRARFHVHPGT